MEIDTALTGRRFDNSPWQISIPTVPWEFSWEITVFFLLVISPQYIWGEASTPVVRNSDWRFPMGHPWGIHGDDHP